MKLTLLILDYAQSTLLSLTISISFSFSLFLGECNASSPEEESQYLGKVPEAIRSAACGQADIWQNEDIGKQRCELLSCHNQCYMFGNCTALRVWKGKGITRPGEVSTKF